MTSDREMGGMPNMTSKKVNANQPTVKSAKKVNVRANQPKVNVRAKPTVKSAKGVRRNHHKKPSKGDPDELVHTDGDGFWAPLEIGAAGGLSDDSYIFVKVPNVSSKLHLRLTIEYGEFKKLIKGQDYKFWDSRNPTIPDLFFVRPVTEYQVELDLSKGVKRSRVTWDIQRLDLISSPGSSGEIAKALGKKVDKESEPKYRKGNTVVLGDFVVGKRYPTPGGGNLGFTDFDKAYSGHLAIIVYAWPGLYNVQPLFDDGCPMMPGYIKVTDELIVGLAKDVKKSLHLFQIKKAEQSDDSTCVHTDQKKEEEQKKEELMFVITDGDGDISMDGPYDTVKDAVAGAKDELDGSSCGDPEDIEVTIVKVIKKLKTKVTLEEDD